MRQNDDLVIAGIDQPLDPKRPVREGPNPGAHELDEAFAAPINRTPRMDVERAFDCGDEVLLFVRVRGQGSHTGIPLDVQIAQLVTLRDGKVVRVKVFPDRDEALEAAGLSD